MHHVLIAGGGKIGTAIAHLLSASNRYAVTLADHALDYIHAHFADRIPKNLELVELDLTDHSKLIELVHSKSIEAVVSCLPYFCNMKLAECAHKANIHYFDLTEDRETASFIKDLAKNSDKAFVPQCGLAPGFIDIIANDLMQHFAQIEDVKLRCGALPVNASNALQYSLTWSPDGLINEYGNPCEAVLSGKKVELPPLENLETIQIDGLNYEAFNTSGGIGSLAETHADKVSSITYKSIRYPGHCEKVRFLMNGLKLNQDRATLKKILLNALPYTTDDVVIIYVSVTGRKKIEFTREGFVQKYYPKIIEGSKYTAIQMTTATSACAVVDIILNDPEKYHGRILQEQFSLQQLTNNHFGQYLQASQHAAPANRAQAV